MISRSHIKQYNKLNTCCTETDLLKDGARDLNPLVEGCLKCSSKHQGEKISLCAGHVMCIGMASPLSLSPQVIALLLLAARDGVFAMCLALHKVTLWYPQET